MNKPKLAAVSAPVPTCPQVSPTGQDRTGDHRRGQDLPSLHSFHRSNVVATTRGTRNLREYLNAPEHVQRQFDKRLDDEIRKSLEAERAMADLTWDDPYATPTPADPIPLRWDASWSKRAKRPAPKPGEPEPYSRDTDPLLDLDLREVWVALTGNEVRGEMASCPLPDHHDRFPSCTVKAEFWRCHACQEGGSVLDLGAVIYGLEPRGRSFFDIRRRLLADLGMDEERRAA